MPLAQGSQKPSVQQVTDDILKGLQTRETAKKDAKKAAAKSAAAAKKAAKTTDAAKPKAAAKAKAVLPTISKKGLPKTISKPSAGNPVRYGACSIYHGKDRWRVTTEGNRRFDKSFPYKREGSWRELVDYCQQNV